MEFAISQAELFPVVATATRRRSRFAEMLEAIEKHGPLLSQAVVATGLDLSRERIRQLTSAGRLPTVDVHGHKLIPLAALDLFLTEERKNGRPVKELTLGEAVRKGLKKKS